MRKTEGESGEQQKEFPDFACDAAQVRASPGGLPKKRARVREAEGDADAGLWRLEPHVCRVCFGRLVSQHGLAGTRRFLCTNCGADGVGLGSEVLCACGLHLRKKGDGYGTISAGLSCQPNPAPRPDFPSLFVAAETPKLA